MRRASAVPRPRRAPRGLRQRGRRPAAAAAPFPRARASSRAGSLAFVSIDSDTSSSQWKQLDELAQKFPDRDELLAQLKQQLSAQGVDYDTDVKPALGPELDVAVVSAGDESSAKPVALTKPDDPAKFKALVAKLNAKDSSGERAVYREVDGWYALSDSQASISRRRSRATRRSRTIPTSRQRWTSFRATRSPRSTSTASG